MPNTIGIKEALIEYLQDHVLNKELTKIQVHNIEKLFVQDESKQYDLWNEVKDIFMDGEILLIHKVPTLLNKYSIKRK